MKRIISIIAAVMIVAVMFCSCGASSSKYQENVDIEEEYSTDSALNGELADLTDVEHRKLIRRVDISAETKDFEGFLEAFEAAVGNSGGYIQSQNIQNSEYDALRNGYIIVRIPSEKLDGFVGSVSKSANILSRSSELEDITDQYIDVESRIKALETEHSALLSMLEKASSISDIMSIQSRITEVRGSLESYKSRQKQYDNEVAYSTLSINIQEVEREIKNDPGFWNQAGNAISNSFRGVGKILRGLALFIIGALPYLLLIGVVTVAVLVIVKARRKAILKRKPEKNKTNN